MNQANIKIKKSKETKRTAKFKNTKVHRDILSCDNLDSKALQNCYILTTYLNEEKNRLKPNKREIPRPECAFRKVLFCMHAN